jgi:3-dehydroquinate dehydratase II
MSDQIRILVINGPNLDMLEFRDPKLYGSITLDEIEELVTAAAMKRRWLIETFQSNHEGDIIDEIHEAVRRNQKKITPRFGGILINAGGLTHTSVSIRDALAIAKRSDIPSVEVHLSKISEREKFRRVSRIRDVCIAHVEGLQERSYLVGLEELEKYLRREAKKVQKA